MNILDVSQIYIKYLHKTCVAVIHNIKIGSSPESQGVIRWNEMWFQLQSKTPSVCVIIGDSSQWSNWMLSFESVKNVMPTVMTMELFKAAVASIYLANQNGRAIS